MTKKILLIEPKARTSYPPLGLMKIATYHTLKGHTVTYICGKDKKIRDKFWDKIYITSVFTYSYSSLIDTIRYYGKNTANKDIQVGGIAATLLADKIAKDTKIKPHKGLLDTEDPFLKKIASHDKSLEYLLQSKACIDNLPPDYNIFPKNTKYSKILSNSYLFYTTKGCPNNCGFCAVKTLEPNYVSYIPIKPRIEYISKHHGDKAGLLLLDNNIAASDSYFDIIDEIKDCGFHKDAKLSYIKNGRSVSRQRFVDFNQGVDLRLMTKEKMAHMGKIAIKPLRLAFDSISLASLYKEKMQLAIDSGINQLSNYMLFNYKDKPEDLYNRLAINLKLLKQNPGTKIFSFPMRYSPITRTDRKYVGQNWTLREIRAVQLILQATHGIVSHKLPFFSRAFGRDTECFKKVLLYPYHYIINRNIVEYNTMLLQQWEYDYDKLSNSEKKEFKEIIHQGILKKSKATNNKKINNLLEHYENEYASIKDDHDFTGLAF